MQSAKLIINKLKLQTALLYKRQKHRPAINSTVLRYPHKTSTLRSNRNISALKDGTLKSAEIINFWQSQSVENQCLFFCQNVTYLTGKEKDSETGFYYFGARYYDPDLSGLFLSVDPMSDKYPSLSPYAYCTWNPIKMVDPNGEFGIPTHRKIVKEAIDDKGFSKRQYKQIIWGNCWSADVFHPRKDIHMDNYNNYDKIKDRLNKSITGYSKKTSNDDFKGAGYDLHTIADFYSHSNYVELYQKYVGGAELGVDDIPIFTDVIDNPKYGEFNQILEKELRTGDFSNGLKDSFSKDDVSHKRMNHDTPNKIMGKRKYGTITGFEFAVSLAQREINKTVGKNNIEQ